MTSSPRPNKPRDHFLVAVLKLLPERSRVPVVYTAMLVGLAAFWIGMHHAPTITVAGGVGWQLVKSWLAGR